MLEGEQQQQPPAALWDDSEGILSDDTPSGMTTSLVPRGCDESDCEGSADSSSLANDESQLGPDQPVATTTIRTGIVTLNEDQAAFIRWLEDPKNSRKSAFITGPAGTGKSCLIEQAVAVLERQERNFARTASTGAAAFNIGGTTVHSALNVGACMLDIDKLRKRMDKMPSAFTDKWMEMDDLIIDELPMISAEAFEKIVAVAKHLRPGRPPLRFLFFGDFFQLPPVMEKKEREEREAKNLPIYCFQTDAWRRLRPQVFYLNKIERQEDRAFAEILSRVRTGDKTPADDAFFAKRVAATREARLRSLPAGARPPQLNQITRDPEYEHNLTRIRTNNPDVDTINLAAFDITRNPNGTSVPRGFEQTFKVYAVPARVPKSRKLQDFAEASPNQLAKHKFEVEAMQKLLVSQCTADRPLRLRVGVEVVIVCNIDTSSGLVNGARGTVLGFCGIMDDLAPELTPEEATSVAAGATKPHPIVRLHHNQRIVRIDPYAWKTRTPDGRLEGRLEGSYPLRLAAAITSHKAQGATIHGRLEASIHRGMGGIFDYGQAYVVLSRVTNSENLLLLQYDPAAVLVDPIVKAFHEAGYTMERPRDHASRRRRRSSDEEEDDIDHRDTKKRKSPPTEKRRRRSTSDDGDGRSSKRRREGESSQQYESADTQEENSDAKRRKRRAQLKTSASSSNLEDILRPMRSRFDYNLSPPETHKGRLL
ncbi:PIF1-like helicase [Medusavirus stheno T3]|uniref:PIF1-like helicase n=1 Tax=Medusavirus stheno T3 TaxID=3069717 RepID=A0A7S8BET7_9VIRU|nr:PIF1-like helicase [Acanthamoeba castellanii medusavirus]QPB44483.1 PIF1-like helicase [Medusavirus stheno T3]